MHITLNGDAREFPLDTTVVELLDTLGYAGKRVAVERNGEIVPKSQHAQNHAGRRRPDRDRGGGGRG